MRKIDVMDNLEKVNAKIAFLNHAITTNMASQERQVNNKIAFGLQLIFYDIEAELAVVSDNIQEHAIFGVDQKKTVTK